MSTSIDPLLPEGRSDDAQVSFGDDQRLIVLCVDDDPDIVRSLELRLGDQGYQMICAFTGMQAYWHAINRRPDVIITDIRMPQGDGTCLLECLKRNPVTASIPVIALSGLRGEDLPGRVCNLGAERFVHKPVDFEELLELIRSVVPVLGGNESENTKLTS